MKKIWILLLPGLLLTACGSMELEEDENELYEQQLKYRETMMLKEENELLMDDEENEEDEDDYEEGYRTIYRD